MEEVTGKVVFITGGTSGYGYESAKQLTAKGAIVIIAARKQDELDACKKEGICADTLQMDVTEPTAWDKAVTFVKETYGKIDVLVNNAGGGVKITDTVNQTIEDIDMAIKLNLNSVIYGSRAFGTMMKEQKSGLIINVSSVCAKEAWPGWSVYASAKWGVLGFSKGLYVELQPFGVRCSCIVPAAASTGFNRHMGVPDYSYPNQLRAEDVGQAVVDLCEMPSHICVEEITVWGIGQVVNPL